MSREVRLNPRETAHVQVSIDFPGSPTDHAIIAVYTTLDDTSEVWDLIPMMEFLIENTTAPNRISFLVTGVYKFRVGVRRFRVHRHDHQRRPEPPSGWRQRLAMAVLGFWPRPSKWPIQPGTVDPGQRWVWHTRPRLILPTWEHVSALTNQRHRRLRYSRGAEVWLQSTSMSMLRTRSGPALSLPTTDGDELEPPNNGNRGWSANEPYTTAFVVKSRSSGAATRHIFRCPVEQQRQPHPVHRDQPGVPTPATRVPAAR